MEWKFEGIDLPDSNSNEAASHGLVTFRIRPIGDQAGDNLITNVADILFNLNRPARIMEATVLLEFGVGLLGQGASDLHFFPNPATQLL